MAQMIVIYRAPKNPAAFDRHYFQVHAPLCRQLPGLKSFETSRGPIISLYGAAEAHLVSTLRFDSLSDINAAFTSLWAPHAHDVQMFLFDSRSI